MKAEGIPSCKKLQAYFTRRYADIVKPYGKRPVCWEKALSDDLPEDIVIQPWEAGHYPSNLKKHQMINNWSAYMDFKSPMWSHYRHAPGRILIDGKAEMLPVSGSEVSIWTENVPERVLMMHAWPCAMALAERIWSSRKQVAATAISDLYRRVEKHSQVMEAPGFNIQ